MTYTLADLNKTKETLTDKLIAFGASKELVENPAFAQAMGAIRSTMDYPTVPYDRILVSEEDGVIHYSWKEGETEYSVGLGLQGENQIQCVRTVHNSNRGYSEEFNKTLEEKDITETVVELDGGAITVSENSAMVTNGTKDDRTSFCITSADVEHYSKEGFVISREIKRFPGGQLDNNFQNVRTDSALYIPRQAFTYGFWSDKYVQRALIRREQIDTAFVIDEDRENGYSYRGQEPLNSEHGLQNLVRCGGGDLSQGFMIPPAGEEEINQELAKDDPKIAEALKQTYGTTRNPYDPTMDKYFEYREGNSSKTR